MNVDVYWNLTKKCFSIRYKGVVIGHARELLIRDAQYVVQQSGRDRFLATGHKYVHAFVRGHLEAWKGETTRAGERKYLYPLWTREDRANVACAKRVGKFVSYNPSRDSTFVHRPQVDSYRNAVLEHEERRPIERSEGLAWLGKHQNKPFIYDFDPCLIQEETNAHPSAA